MATRRAPPIERRTLRPGIKKCQRSSETLDFLFFLWLRVSRFLKFSDNRGSQFLNQRFLNRKPRCRVPIWLFWLPSVSLHRGPIWVFWWQSHSLHREQILVFTWPCLSLHRGAQHYLFLTNDNIQIGPLCKLTDGYQDTQISPLCKLTDGHQSTQIGTVSFLKKNRAVSEQ